MLRKPSSFRKMAPYFLLDWKTGKVIESVAIVCPARFLEILSFATISGRLKMIPKPTLLRFLAVCYRKCMRTERVLLAVFALHIMVCSTAEAQQVASWQ